MTNKTVNFNMKMLEQNQININLTMNENILKIDKIIHLSVKSKTIFQIPDPENGDIYIIPNIIDTDSIFFEKDNKIAIYNINLGWEFLFPKNGMLCYIQDEDKIYIFRNGNWNEFFSSNSDIDDNLLNSTTKTYSIDKMKSTIVNIVENTVSQNSNVEILLKSNNLNDIVDKSVARTNLDVPKKSANLSDLNIISARENLNVYSKEETYYKSNCLADIPNRDNACHNIGTLRDWEIRSIGDYKFSAKTIDHNGWYICNGRELSRTNYSDLFAIIGISFGIGDNSTTFNIPDFRGRVFGAIGQGKGLINRGIGQIIGEENHTLTIAETPSHRHAQTISGGLGTEVGYPWSAPDQLWGVQARYTDYQGGNQPHNNMQPTLFGGNVFIFTGII